MSIPLGLPMWLAALCPILLLLILLLKCKWSAAKASVVGFCAAALIAALCFKTSVRQMVLESLKGGWSAVSILLVIWTAIALYELMAQAGAFTVLRCAIQRIAGHELLAILIAGFVFPSFLQGITGFGVAVAVGAPLLVGIGVKPKWAVIIVLLCHSWGGTFGTLALAWQALLAQAGVGADVGTAAAVYAGGFIWIVNFVGAMMLCFFYGGRKGLQAGFPAALLISAIHGAGQMLLAGTNPVIACFLPACVAFLAVLLLAKCSPYKKSWRHAESKIMGRSRGSVESAPSSLSFHQALSPYYILTGVTVLCLLITPVRQFLGQVQVGFAFPQAQTGYGYVTAAEECFSPLSPFTHPGFFLALTCLATYALYRRSGALAKSDLRRCMKRTVKKTVPSSLAILGFTLTSRIMGCSGEVLVLARGVAAVLGKGYALVTPLVGLLGSFMTSSNMASNILFAKFQVTIAELVDISAAAALGAQTAGGAIGNAICPGNLVLGTSTAGLGGQEGEILKTVLPIAVFTALLCGVLHYALVFFGA